MSVIIQIFVLMSFSHVKQNTGHTVYFWGCFHLRHNASVHPRLCSG